MTAHGTVSRYKHGGCRCDACTDAQAAAMRAYKAIPRDPADLRHGELSTYNNYGCRCLPCTAAKADDQAARKPKISR
jgi:hypothetical protein